MEKTKDQGLSPGALQLYKFGEERRGQQRRLESFYKVEGKAREHKVLERKKK